MNKPTASQTGRPRTGQRDMRRTDNGTEPPAARVGRPPQDGLLPELSLYERLIDNGTAAADARDRPVDHVTARRLAIWLAPGRKPRTSPRAWSASSKPERSARR